jgi:hypothetical protein
VTIDAAAAAVANYVAAWDAPDEDERRTALERAWTDDGVYRDPTAVVEGRDALVAHIGGFHGARVVATSGVDAYDGYLRFAWQMLDADGLVTLEGIDFGELAPDGRLKRIVGFFGPLPPPAGASRPR